MKKTNLLTILYTGLITSVLVSTASVAAIPTTELLKAEPVNKLSLKNSASISLMQSFTIIEIDNAFTKKEANTDLALKKEQANKNKPVTLANTSQIAD